MRRIRTVLGMTVTIWLLGASAAWACGGLVAANGAVRLVRTSTLAAYSDGVEHYVTSFEFGSAEESFGSIVPLPDVPTTVERAGDWTLQRLARETQPDRVQVLAAGAAGTESAAAEVEVLIETTVDSLDITVVRGGGAAVAEWAAEQGFELSDDAPAVLDFYAERSPVFMAARFDATRAGADGLTSGDGVPIHLAIPTDDPWVPLRILGLGKPGDEVVEADVYLLTPREPALLHGDGITTEVSRPATDLLLDDLRSDANSAWIPDEAWLTYLRVEAPAAQLDYDLAIDASGAGSPSPVDAGFGPLAAGLQRAAATSRTTVVALLAAGALIAVIVATLRRGAPRLG